MNFNKHSNLAGTHAFLSASNNAWVNYDEEKLERVYLTSRAAQRGTELHAFACEAIRLGIKLPANKQTLSLYVNDAIGFRMSPEQMLYYSDNCYGTPDAIGFRKNVLRIHDLKTGVHRATFRQLVIYSALFCLEYGFKPGDLKIILRIYQNDAFEEVTAEMDEVFHIMSTIIAFDQRIEALRLELQA